MHDTRLCKAGFCPLTWGYFRVEGKRVFVKRNWGGKWIDLGEFECPRHMHECNVLGCPVHTPSQSWPVRRAIERFVDREERAFKDRVEEARAAMRAGDEALIEYLRGEAKSA